MFVQLFGGERSWYKLPGLHKKIWTIKKQDPFDFSIISVFVDIQF